MAKSNRPSPAPRQQRSWRTEAAAPMTPLARRSRLVLVTVVVCALAAAMAYALYVPHEPQTHLVYTTLVEHKELTAPPWAKTFLAADELEKLTSKTVQSPQEIEIEQKEILPALGSRIREMVGDKQDRLLALVGGQGVSRVDPESENQNKAYLLLSTFDPSKPGTGYLSIESLLAEVGNCQASAKVLVLDAGNIVCDPRIGMLANEFPPLVEQAVRETKDPNLWVLLSNWTWEISHLSNEKQRSVFSYYVSQALQGNANRQRSGAQDDRVVDLRELYDYVYFGVSKWVPKAHGANSSQHPILLNGEKGRIRRLEEISDVPLVAMAPEPPPATLDNLVPDTSAPAPAAQSNPPAAQHVAAVLAIGMPIYLAQADNSDPPPATAAPTPAAETAPASPPAAQTTPAAAVPSTATPNSPAPAVESAPATSPSTSASPPATAPAATPEAPAATTPATTPAPSDPTPPSPADAKPAIVKPVPASPPTPRSLALARLIEGWKLRDRIEREARLDATQTRSPADFAPHKWREHQERLLHYELMFRSGEDPNDINSKLPDNILLLADIADGKPMERRHRLSLISPLAEDWERYRSLKSPPSYREFVVQAMALRADLLVRIPYFVRWYAVTSLVSPGDEPSYDSLQKLIADVAALSKVLDASRINTTQRYDEAEVKELVGRIEADQARLMAAAPRPEAKPTISEVDCYLSTPLPSADERAALLAWLETIDLEQFYFDDLAKEFPNRTTAPDDLLGPPGGNSDEPWERVDHLAQLELAVAELVDTGSGLLPDDDDLLRELRVLRDAVAKAAAPVEGEPAEVEIDRWRLTRNVGSALEGFYAEIVTQIRNRQKEIADQTRDGDEQPDPRQIAGIEHLYQLLDARDADQSELGSLVPLLESSPDDPVETDITFDFEPAEQLVLDARKETTPLQLVTRLRRGRPTEAWVTLKYDPQLLDILDVTSTGEGTAVVNPSERVLADISQRPKTFSLNGSAPLERFMNFEVRATPEARQRLQPGDAVTVTAGLYYREADLSVVGPIERTILVRPALPEVELIVAGPATRNPAPGSGATLVLNPFPNKETNYQFQVFNRGKEPQEVKVEIIAVPSRLGELVRERWPLNVSGQPVQEGVRLLKLATGSCTVPPSGTVPIKFDQPAAPAPAANTTAPPPSPDAAPVAEPPLPSIDYGIVCLLEDEAGRRSVTNIDIEPQRPADFLDVDVTWDKDKAQRVQVVVFPHGRNPAVMPPDVCSVIWNWRGELEPDRAKKDAAELVPPAYAPAQLFADVPTSQSAVRVQLDVDGFPRAFAYRLEIERDVSRPLRDEERVQITSPAEDGFPILAPADSIPVQFQVDVPADAFKSRGANQVEDVVEIGLVDTDRKPLPPGKVLPFHSDRQIARFLTGTAEDGSLTIKTVVKDFDVSLPIAGLSNQRIGILASFKRNRRVVVEAYREIFLDATEPLVTVVGDTAGGAGSVKVEKGAEATVFAEVQDEGGVEKVEFFVVKPAFDVERDWKNPEKLPPESAIGGVFRNNRWEASIPTSDLNGANWLLLARATDRVELQHKKAVPFEVSMPAGPDGGGNMPAMLYDLKGVVVGDKITTVTVTLEEPKRTRKPRPNEEFVFENLPKGEYTLTLDGIARNMVQPSKSVSVTLPQEKPVEIRF